MEKQGICSLTHTPPPLPLVQPSRRERASLVGLVGGAIPPSLAFHPAAKVSTPMDGGIPVCPVNSQNWSELRPCSYL
jgi:hypothetical protein